MKLRQLARQRDERNRVAKSVGHLVFFFHKHDVSLLFTHMCTQRHARTVTPLRLTFFFFLFLFLFLFVCLF